MDYFIPGCDWIEVWQNSKILQAASSGPGSRRERIFKMDSAIHCRTRRPAGWLACWLGLLADWPGHAAHRRETSAAGPTQWRQEVPGSKACQKYSKNPLGAS